MATHSFTYLSLFSGIGGLDLGVRLALPAARCVGYVEREAFSAAVLAARMETETLDPAPVWSDVRTFPVDLYRGRVDMVAGGFPCQDLSVAGRRDGIHGARSSLYFDLLRIAREVGAEYLVLENVSGVFVRGTFDIVLGALAEDGWDAEWLRLRASDVGAPHRRERWFCLARRSVDHAGIGRRHDDGAAAGLAGGDRADDGLSLPPVADVADPGCQRRQQDAGGPPRDESADGWQPDGDHLIAGAGQSVADTARVLQGQAGELGAGVHPSGRGGAGVADATLGRCRVERPAAWPGCERHADGGEPPVDDAAGTRRNGRRGEPGSPLWDEARGGESGGRRDAVADAAGTEPPLRRGDRRDVREERAAATGSDSPLADAGERQLPVAGRGPERRAGTGPAIPVFPPGPAERERWAGILARDPTLAPALEPTVRGDADGTAGELDDPLIYRTDRLRALGNGVVPLQAAVAIDELWRRLHT